MLNYNILLVDLTVLYDCPAASSKLEEFELVYFQNGTINPHYRTIQERSEKTSCHIPQLLNWRTVDVYEQAVHRHR